MFIISVTVIVHRYNERSLNALVHHGLKWSKLEKESIA